MHTHSNTHVAHRKISDWSCIANYTTKLDTCVCPPHVSETVAVRIMKLAHRPRIASTTNKLISKKNYCPFYQFNLRQFKRFGTPSTPNIALINMDNLGLLSDRSLCVILFSLLIRISAVAQRLECATDNRVFTGSSSAVAVWKLLQFPLPHFASVFRKRH